MEHRAGRVGQGSNLCDMWLSQEKSSHVQHLTVAFLRPLETAMPRTRHPGSSYNSILEKSSLIWLCITENPTLGGRGVGVRGQGQPGQRSIATTRQRAKSWLWSSVVGASRGRGWNQLGVSQHAYSLSSQERKQQNIMSLRTTWAM